MNRLIYLNKIVARIEKEGVSTSMRVPTRASFRGSPNSCSSRLFC
jgi:hypothetical protein